MILLDTNVLSEIMQQIVDPAVVEWLNRQPRASVWTTAITILEIRRGILSLPNGKRRFRIAQEFDRLVEGVLEGRVAGFDEAAAEATAALITEREKRGVDLDLEDSMIAGIAIARHATLATRNARHFNDLPGKVVNPWLDQP